MAQKGWVNALLSVRLVKWLSPLGKSFYSFTTPFLCSPVQNKLLTPVPSQLRFEVFYGQSGAVKHFRTIDQPPDHLIDQ